MVGEAGWSPYSLFPCNSSGWGFSLLTLRPHAGPSSLLPPLLFESFVEVGGQ